MTHRKCRAAAGVAVHLRQYDAGYVEQIVKALGDVDRVLSGHRVNHEQYLGRIQLGFYIAQLVHHVLVDMKPTGGVDEHHVVSVFDSVRNSLLRDLDRFYLVPELEHRNVELSADDLELLYRRRTVYVAGDEQRTLALFFIHTRELCRVRGLARAL